ncbi:MAG: TlpA family protein disulfide reductase [Desulfobacterales bacterium]|nr:MAG: TlpA family protein disulfide reductase [Desulfobacterales bacterium]
MEERKFNYRLGILVFFAVTIFLVLFSLWQNDSILKTGDPTQPAVGLPAPDFTFPELSGKMISLSDYKGQVVLVNIWATWCPPCVAEMPSMERLYQELQNEKFAILAVSIDAKGSQIVAPFMKKYKLTFPALIDAEGKMKTTYKATGVPESFIIDQNGILIKKIIGPRDWAAPEIFRFFRDLIQRPPPPQSNKR